MEWSYLRCECKKLIDKGICDKEFIGDPSNCETKCDKSCDVGDVSIMKIANAEKD